MVLNGWFSSRKRTNQIFFNSCLYPFFFSLLSLLSILSCFFILFLYHLRHRSLKFVLSCLVLSCLVLTCLVLSCLVLSCLALSCLVFSFAASFTKPWLSLFFCCLFHQTRYKGRDLGLAKYKMGTRSYPLSLFLFLFLTAAEGSFALCLLVQVPPHVPYTPELQLR